MDNDYRLYGTNQKQGQDYNKSVVFEHIRLYGPISRTEISTRTLLVPQTVSNLVKVLIDDGLVLERTGSVQKGRRGAIPTNLVVREDARFALGIQVQYSRIVGALIDLNGNILKRCEISGNRDNAVQMKRDLSRIIDSLISESAVATNLLGIGLGVPMFENFRTDTVGGYPSFPFRSQVELREELEHRYSYPIIIGNNAQMAAVGEYWMGRGRVPRTFLYVYLGEYVGGGMILDGDSYAGVSGRAVELGHTQYMPDGRQCYCGMRGCLDQYGSANAIKQSLDLHRDVSLETVVQMSRNGNTGASRALNDGVMALSDGMVNALMLFDAPACIVGGPNANMLFALLQPHLTYKISARGLAVEVLKSEIDIYAGAIGAASTVFHEALWCKPSTLLKM